jgi:hypothetical protein
MTFEERLRRTLRSADGYAPSSDLWDRVVHSIEEDRIHRRRVRRVVGAIGVMFVVLAALVAVNVESVDGAHRVDWRWMEGIVAGALVALILTLGPGLRRFGRGYAGEVFAAHPPTGELLLRLIDVAYYLVFTGFVLVSTRLQAPDAYLSFGIGTQIEEALARVGGLLLVMGLLHAVTLLALPVVGLVFTSTRASAKLPRWLTVVLVIAAIWITLQAIVGFFAIVGQAG